MFMPLYFPAKMPPKVVIVGGGYAGLAALVTLRERRPDALISLIDPSDHHLKITHLHESFRRPLADLKLPFEILEKRFKIRHIRSALSVDKFTLMQWVDSRQLSVNGEMLEFDYLLLATGTGHRRMEKGDHSLALEDFTKSSGPDLLDSKMKQSGSAVPCISVIGSGATGIQFLFEIAHHISARSLPWHLRLVDAGNTPLQQFNPKLGRYVESRLEDKRIEYVPHRFFRSQSSGSIELEDADTGEHMTLPSAVSLLFVGMNPESRIETNLFGQVMLDGKTLPRVFAAGDCSQHKMPGSNALSAQTALRKGRLAARNILRHSSTIKLLEPYIHRDLGYVIGMGPTDAVGWIALEGNIVAGQPAALIKEVVEAQYDLLLAGTDTYIL